MADEKKITSDVVDLGAIVERVSEAERPEMMALLILGAMTAIIEKVYGAEQTADFLEIAAKKLRTDGMPAVGEAVKYDG